MYKSRVLMFLQRMPRPGILALGILFVAGIGFADWYTVGLSMIFLQALVVLMASFFAGFAEALTLTVLATAATVLAKAFAIEGGSTTIQIAWSGAMAFSASLVTTIVATNLRKSWQQELRLSRTDPLTGALSLRSFLEIASGEIHKFKRVRKPFTLAYFDIDNFKPVNDQFGHAAGDKLLREVVRTALLSLRSNDFLARMGADEFSILLPETNVDAGYQAVKRIQESLVAEMEKKGWHVTFSIGVVTFLEPPEDVDKMIKSADELMAGVKRASKNAILHRVYDGKELRETKPPQA